MPHPLENKLRAVRLRVRRLLLLYGISRLAVVLLTVVGLWCLADYLVHIQDRGLRILGWLLAIGSGAWAGWRYVVSAWRATLGDLDVALRIGAGFRS